MSEAVFSLIDLDVTIPRGLRLLAGLNGFTDAGGSIAQTAEHIFQTSTPSWLSVSAMRLFSITAAADQ